MDLATLGVRIESQEAEIADKRLDDLAASAANAENHVDKLAAAARGTNTAVSSMNVAVRQQTTVLATARSSMGLTAQEGLNLSRQFADIGVTMAMGMNPLMIALQQGPQLFDIMQSAAVRSGSSIRAAMVATGAVVWTALAPLLPIIAAIAAAGGLVAAGWGIATRGLRKDIGDVGDGLNLTAQQMKRLEEAGVTTSVTAGDAFRGLGTTIKEMLVEVFDKELKWVKEAWNSFLDGATKVAVAAFIGINTAALGTFYAIRDTWKMLPAVLGDAAITSANAVIRAVEWMANRAVDTINGLIAAAKELAKFVPLLAPALLIPELGQFNFGEISNPFAGAITAMGAQIAKSYDEAGNVVEAGAKEFWERWKKNTDASRDARVLKAAGDPGKASTQGKSEAEKEYDRLVKASEQFRDALQRETAEIGLNNIQRKMLGVEAAAAIAPTKELADQIRAAGAAWREATIRDIRSEAFRDIAQESAAVRDHMAMLELEADLIGASNEERARQLAMLQKELDLRARAAQIKRSTGVDVDLVNSAEGQQAIKDAGEAASQAEELRRTERAARGLEDSLVDVVTGTKKAKDAFRDMARDILAELARVNIRKYLIAPLFGGGGFFGLGGGIPQLPTTPDISMSIGSAANGSRNTLGDWMWTGENGPELVKLPRGSDVQPAEPSGRRGMDLGQALSAMLTIKVEPNDERFNAYVDGRTDPKIRAAASAAEERAREMIWDEAPTANAVAQMTGRT